MTSKRLLLSASVVAMAAVPAVPWAQRAEYPITIIAPGEGSYTFPPGYQTPWDKVEIRVTEKMSPNLFVLHGSEGLDPAHPDASGGRAMVLFGPDGVLMVDTQNRQVAEKTLAAIRSFTNAPIKVLVNTHIHGAIRAPTPSSPSRGVDLCRKSTQRDAAAAAAREPGAGARYGRGSGRNL